jgi:CheY-like chemotaxis protein
MGQALNGVRVLIVEDEALVVMMIEDMLEQLGCEVVGIAPRLPQAKEMVQSTQFDCALLDINLAGQTVYPLALELIQRGAAFIFVTGYDKPDMLKRFRDRPVLRKPFDVEALAKALVKVVSPLPSAASC